MGEKDMHRRVRDNRLCRSSLKYERVGKPGPAGEKRWNSRE